MCRICRDAEYVSCAEVFECGCDSCSELFDEDWGDDVGKLFILGAFLGTWGGAISLPILVCKYVIECNWLGELGLTVSGFCGGAISGVLLSAVLTIVLTICIPVVVVTSYILCFCPTYICCNIPYIINCYTRGFCNVASYTINKLTNCCSRLVRLVGLSARNEQETDVESSSAEELSEITTSSSHESESSGSKSISTTEPTPKSSGSSSASSTTSSESEVSYNDSVENEQTQSQLSRRPSFASLMNPFSIFYRSEQSVSEATLPGRRSSFTSIMNPFSFFKASSKEADLESGNTVSSNSEHSDSDNSYNSTQETFHSI